MADASQLQLNPYALFDPSQWANPYSQYQNQALPAASYAGVPTNYAGQPIQPQPGMTINSSPAQSAPAAAAAAPSYGQPGTNPWATLQAAGASPQQMAGFMSQMQPTYGGGGQNPNYSAMIGRVMAGAGGQGAPQAAPAAGANSAGLTPQQYMQMRANPGNPPVYGANVPMSASSAQPTSGQGGVLQQFLANWKPASSGPGAGFQQGFAAGLKNQGY